LKNKQNKSIGSDKKILTTDKDPVYIMRFNTKLRNVIVI